MSDKIFPLTPYLTLIGPNLVLDKRYGSIVRIDDSFRYGDMTEASSEVLREILAYLNKSNIVIDQMNQNADVVVGVDSLDIDFYLKTSNGTIDPKSGFLVEVFESGSDGKLTKLYQDDLVDPVDENKTLEDGFSNYFTLKLDPEE